MFRNQIVKIALVFLTLVSCGYGKVSEQSKLKHVKLQLKWTHAFQFAGYYMAQQNGYYRDAGLDVAIIEGGAVPTGVAQSGEVEDYMWKRSSVLSTRIDIEAYIGTDGIVRLELSTVNEEGSSDIVVYAWMENSWQEVGRVSAAEIVGFGSNTYRIQAFGLLPGETYLFKVIDESGKVFYSSPTAVSDGARIKMKKVKLTGNQISLTFSTEYGCFYQMMSASELGPSAEWSVEKVSYPVAKGWSASSAEPFMAGPGESTTVLVQRTRKKAFFKIIKIQ